MPCCEFLVHLLYWLLGFALGFNLPTILESGWEVPHTHTHTKKLIKRNNKLRRFENFIFGQIIRVIGYGRLPVQKVVRDQICPGIFSQ